MKADLIHDGEILTLPFADSTSLVLPAEYSFEEWEALGERLAAAEQRLPWLIGDWWVYGGHHYGDRAAAAARGLFGLAFGTLANMGMVARKFETSRRREVVPFSFHQEVAPLPPADADRLLDEAVAEQWGQKDLREAVRRYRNDLARAELDALGTIEAGKPDGKYHVLVVDPPWPMQRIELDERPYEPPFDYPVMDEDELIAFGDIIDSFAADDCHLFLWTTQKFLPMAWRLLDDWGFRYVLMMVWHKPGGFQPFDLPQYNCEFIVYARRGSPVFVDTRDFNCCFEAPRREHSRKPDEFYDLLCRVTAGRRLDVFARGPRDGFDVYGNEAEKFAGAA